MSAPDTALHFQNALGIGRAIRQGTLTSRRRHAFPGPHRARRRAQRVQRGHGRARAGAGGRRRPAAGSRHRAGPAARRAGGGEGQRAMGRHRSHAGSQARAGQISADTAPLRALAAHGMVILGKTRMTEFAFGLSGQNGTQGTARNPWDAVQAARRAARPAARPWPWRGLAPIALGGDTGGSVRAPAALNGRSATSRRPA